MSGTVVLYDDGFTTSLARNLNLSFRYVGNKQEGRGVVSILPSSGNVEIGRFNLDLGDPDYEALVQEIAQCLKDSGLTSIQTNFHDFSGFFDQGFLLILKRFQESNGDIFNVA